jgi:predicted transcriptional regulator
MNPETIDDPLIEADEFFIDDPELIAELKASLEEADRGETIPAEEVMRELRGMREQRP